MYIRVLNRKIHYKRMGKGSPVLFVHGWGENMYQLHALALLASKKYCAYLIDLPGFGKSDNPAEHWGVEGYAVMMKELIEKLKMTRTQYIGHAFGSDIGLYLSSHYSDCIDHLVVCASSFRRQNRISKPVQMMKQIPREQALMRLFYKPLRSLYYSLFHKDSDLLKYPHLEKNFRKIIAQDLTRDIRNVKNKTLMRQQSSPSREIAIAFEIGTGVNARARRAIQ
ncbi:alpha/beta hydrolase [Candidatus Roizmanbacteria bacterium]|nr:MAG: alpha/beta hydrolase [Candidatus Roizmanbacteria bacterium]